MSETTKEGWDRFYDNCEATYRGGYHAPSEVEIFRHGMRTVCNILANSFPHPQVCRCEADYEKVAKAAVELFKADKRSVSGLTANEMEKAVALWKAAKEAGLCE